MRSFRRSFSRETAFPNKKSQRFWEERVSFLLSSRGQNSLHLVFGFVIHSSTAEGIAESLSNASSCQGMASLPQLPKHASFNSYLETSHDEVFPNPNRFNFAGKDLASKI